MPSDWDRFWAKVSVQAETGCWMWTGGSIPKRDNTGQRYGMFHWSGKLGYAHRFAYEYFHGPLPKGKQVDHRCRETLCACPFHLEAVTQATNSQRGRMQRHAVTVVSREGHCRQGHRLNEKNAYLHPTHGSIVCRRCAALRKRTGRPRGRPRKEVPVALHA